MKWYVEDLNNSQQNLFLFLLFKFDISTKKSGLPKSSFLGFYQNTCEQEELSQNNTNKLSNDNNGNPIMAYSPPVIPFVDPNQVALMQAVYTQLVILIRRKLNLSKINIKKKINIGTTTTIFIATKRTIKAKFGVC